MKVQIRYNDFRSTYEVDMPYGDTIVFDTKYQADALVNYINKMEQQLSDYSWGEDIRHGNVQGMW